jgi:hypothetical protein
MLQNLDNLQRLIFLARVVRITLEKVHPNSNMCGFCLDASRQLFRLAKDNGIKDVEIGLNEGHAFVIFNQDTIVDVTATQFGKKRKVLVGKIKRLKYQKSKTESWAKHPWSIKTSHKTIRSANMQWLYKCDNDYRSLRTETLKTLAQVISYMTLSFKTL